MNKQHKHAELIKAWADGAEIEMKIRVGNEEEYGEERWWPVGDTVSWDTHFEYRIKPAVAEPHKPKPDVVVNAYIPSWSTTGEQTSSCHWFEMTVPFAWKEKYKPNLKLTFDGETGKLKSAEVL